MKKLLVLLIKGYQRVTFFKRPSCRFYPSCSNYCIEVIQKYGAIKGGWLAVRRLIKCHPFNPGGIDQAP